MPQKPRSWLVVVTGLLVSITRSSSAFVIPSTSSSSPPPRSVGSTPRQAFNDALWEPKLSTTSLSFVEREVPAVLPEHLALIMDGNGRWAERRGLTRTEGHREGAKRMMEAIHSCRKIGIKYLSTYCLSTENWTRPQSELDVIFTLLEGVVEELLFNAHENKVRVIGIGQLWRLPRRLRELMAEIEKETAVYTDGMVVCLALSYGGRDEVARAAQALAEKARDGLLDPSSIDESLLAAEMQSHTKGLPPVDLLVRTSGERRISNFLLYQIAYAEVIFTATPWPDFNYQELLASLHDYAGRTRRFGGVPSAAPALTTTGTAEAA